MQNEKPSKPRKFLISYTAGTPGVSTVQGRIFATGVLTEECIKVWEEQIKQLGNFEQVGILNIIELEG